MWNVSDSRKQVHLLGVENEKLGRWEKNNYMPIKRKTEFSWSRKGSYYKEEWLETAAAITEVFCQELLQNSFTYSSTETNNFDVCKHCSGTLLIVEDVSHGFEN